MDCYHPALVAMTSILDLPLELLHHVLENCLEDDNPYEAARLGTVHPSFREAVRYIQFGPPHVWASQCLQRLRKEEIGADDSQSEAFSIGSPQTDYTHASWTDSDYCHDSFASASSFKETWHCDRMAKLMDRNLCFMLSQLKTPGTTGISTFHQFLLTYLDTAVSFLMSFPKEKARKEGQATLQEISAEKKRKKEQRQLYKFQLSKAICSAHDRNFITYILHHGYPGSKFDPAERSFTKDPEAMFAAAAAVGSISAMNWVHEYMRTPFEEMVPLQLLLKNGAALPDDWQAWKDDHGRDVTYTEEQEAGLIVDVATLDPFPDYWTSGWPVDEIEEETRSEWRRRKECVDHDIEMVGPWRTQNGPEDPSNAVVGFPVDFIPCQGAIDKE